MRFFTDYRFPISVLSAIIAILVSSLVGIIFGTVPASRASQIARQLLLFGRPIAKEELMERLSALTVERLTDLSSRMFSTKPTLTAVGPVGTLAPYEAILDSLPGTQTTARRLAV